MSVSNPGSVTPSNPTGGPYPIALRKSNTNQTGSGQPPRQASVGRTLRTHQQRLQGVERQQSATANSPTTITLSQGPSQKGQMPVWDGSEWNPALPSFVVLTAVPDNSTPVGSYIAWDGNEWNIQEPASEPDSDQYVLTLAHLPYAPNQIAMWTGTEWEPIDIKDAGGMIRAVQQEGDYTFNSADIGTVQESMSDDPVTFTLPPGEIPIGGVIEVFQYGQGQVTIEGQGDVVLESDQSYRTTAGQFATVGIRARNTSEFVLSGDLTGSQQSTGGSVAT